MYVITGATGNIGKRVCQELLANGRRVRAIGRDAKKLKELTDKGAEEFVGDVTDAAFVKKAFEGATAIFCMIPPSFLSSDFRKVQQQIAHNYADAIHANGIKNVILLSSVGAHLRDEAGIVSGLGDAEEYLAQLKGVNVLNLRPSYFMENLFSQVSTIKQMGVLGSPIQGDLVFPIVATKDIAEEVSLHLQKLDFKGNGIAYVLGQRDVTYNEITKIIGKAIGKPDLPYVQFPYDEAKKGSHDIVVD
jgi:uncharacterized protein YbjT (DUF2867 family)